ncbi:MAG: hypothetical protein K6F80_00830, partial [Oscillospiraceae bacterium]|nr:hypothetical protein [Oscillospiraceae bacterium]
PVSLTRNGDPVKNALDMQLMMFTGYLIGAKQTEQVYIVSKDKDFCLGQEFFREFLHDDSISLQIIPTIADAFGAAYVNGETEEAFLNAADAPQDTHIMQDEYLAAFTHPEDHTQESLAALCEKYVALHMPQETETQEPKFSVQYHSTVRNLLGRGTDENTVSRVCEIISTADTLVDLNNGLARFYRDGERAKEVYHKCKPRFDDLRHLSRARNKG